LAHLVGSGGGLALLVERHDDHRGAVALHQHGVLHERLLALLQRDAVDDALALRALEAGLHDRELGGVDHEGHARDLGVRHQQVDELGHRGDAVD